MLAVFQHMTTHDVERQGPFEQLADNAEARPRTSRLERSGPVSLSNWSGCRVIADQEHVDVCYNVGPNPKIRLISFTFSWKLPVICINCTIINILKVGNIAFCNADSGQLDVDMGGSYCKICRNRQYRLVSFLRT